MLYIASLVVYQLEVDEVVETKVSYYAVIAQQLMFRAITVAIFTITLLRRDLMKRYVFLLNQMDVIFGETDRQFIFKRIFFTVAAITISFTALLITSIIYSELSAHLVKESINSVLTGYVIVLMPVVYSVVMVFHQVITSFIIYWHYVWFIGRLSNVYMQEKIWR